MRWTKLRCRQLELLRRLLLDVSQFNHGSNALGRLAACEVIAERLLKSDLNTPMESFMQFLIGRAGEDRGTSGPSRDAKRWQYAVRFREFPSFNAQIHPEYRPLGWRVPSQHPQDGKAFDPDKFPYYKTAEEAIDTAMAKNKAFKRRPRARRKT